MPTIRRQLEDFEVEELLDESLEGSGAHTYLRVEKRGLDTDRCARLLAQWRGLPRREVGYAGRKDRHAVARQWFSLPGVDPAQAMAFSADGLRVLEAVRHPTKLRLGQLRGNRFRLTVRDVTPAAAAEAEQRLAELRASGLPNLYGEQRFGRDGGNAARGAELLRAPRLRMERRLAWLLVSALQSAVFNEVLRRRPWRLDELVAGDVALEHGSGDVRSVVRPEDLAQRLAAFEVSPTGPIFGTKMKQPAGPVAELESQVMADFDLPDPRRLDPPRGLRLYGSRRALRVPLGETVCEAGDGVVRLAFELPAGSYATVLLGELFPQGVEDATRPPRGASRSS